MTAAAKTTTHHITQRPGAVYRFQAPHAAAMAPVKSATTTATHSVLKLQARVAELEATLADRTAQLRLAFTEAGTDSLTGLKNRRALESIVREAVSNWQRYGHTAAVLLLDLNGFKAINDTHGHAAGDAALQHVAGLLTHHTRTTDVVGRLGGDEFVVVLREVSSAAAITKARQLRAVLAETPLQWGAHTLRLGASIGLATVMEEPSAAGVLKLADARMYAFKRVLKG